MEQESLTYVNIDLLQAIAGRVHGYQHYRAGARMRQLLSNKGGVKVSAEPAAVRMAELKGAEPPQKLAK